MMAEKHSNCISPRKTVSVLAPSFHGATVLSIVLDSHPEIVSLGDTIPRWNQNCVCGAPVLRCKFWKKIINAIGGNNELDDTAPIIDRPNFLSSSRTLELLGLLVLFAISRASPRLAKHLQPESTHRYLTAKQNLIETALSETRKSVFVDGEKSISMTMLAYVTNPNLSRKIIHLVRDPRAFVVSSMKKNNLSLRDSAASWQRTHRNIRAFTRLLKKSESHLVRFEDLSRNPQKVVNNIVDFLDLDTFPVAGEDSQVRLGHQIGNTSYRKHGTKIHPSENWKRVLSVAQQREILSRTYPISSEYGYHIEE